MNWSDHMNKSDIKLNVRGVEWKNLMSECLLATQIKKSKSFSDKRLNPNIIMNIRHQMAKECVKTSVMTRCQIQNEALKLLRENNRRKLIKMKEENTVNKEIEKLEQILKFNEMLRKKCLETDAKHKHEQPRQKISSKTVNFWVIKANRQFRVENIKQTKVSEKKVKETKKQETLSTKREYLSDEKKEECLHKFYERPDKIFNNSFEKEETIEKGVTGVKAEPLPPTLDLINQKRIKTAWQTWRIYIQRQRRRERDKKMYADKIEAFLERLRQQEEGETKAKLRITTCKQEPKTFKLPETATTANNDNERLKQLQKLMREVTTSQMEAFQRLRSRNETMVKAFPNPKFLFRMEERREERLKRRREIIERKEKFKEEKENKEKQKEEEEKKLKEHEKQKRIEELKEKRRLEKKKKEDDKKRRGKIKCNEIIANCHYRKLLLRSYGLRPWMQLMQLADAQYKQAVEFHDRRLLLSLVKWKITIRAQVARKVRRAGQLYNQTLLKRCWNSWVKLRVEMLSKKQVAVDWNDFKMTERTFRTWIWFTEKEQLEYLGKKEIAERHYKRKIKMKCLQKLRRYPDRRREEREIEIRKLKWRQKVKELLPDYRPVKITEDW